MFRLLLVIVILTALPTPRAAAQAGFPLGARIGEPAKPPVLERRLPVVLAAIPTLEIIDAGVVEQINADTRRIRFAACVRNAGSLAITGMRYAWDIPRTSNHSENTIMQDLGPDLTPGKPLQNPGCGYARKDFFICSFETGDYDLTVSADLANGVHLSTKTKLTMPPVAPTITIDPLDDPGRIDMPKLIRGKASYACGSKLGTVRVSSPGGDRMEEVAVGAGGKWEAWLWFHHAGTFPVTASAFVSPTVTLVESSVRIDPVPVQITVTEFPASIPANYSPGASVTVVTLDKKQPLKYFTVNMKLGNAMKHACTDVTNTFGFMSCFLTPISPPVGVQLPLEISSPDAASIVVLGNTSTLVKGS